MLEIILSNSTIITNILGELSWIMPDFEKTGKYYLCSLILGPTILTLAEPLGKLYPEMNDARRDKWIHPQHSFVLRFFVTFLLIDDDGMKILA